MVGIEVPGRRTGAARERVASYEDRLYSDVQLAARRSLATMTLETSPLPEIRVTAAWLHPIVNRPGGLSLQAG